ncbi:Uncharacterized protein C32A11.02c, partial [Grifola frondosa]
MAALNAGKFPSQQQTSKAIDQFLNSPILNSEPPVDSGELSAQGKELMGDVHSVLVAHKQLGEHKNSDNIIQQALWHLSEADIPSTFTDRSFLRTLINVVWENISQEGRSVFHDFASFMRLALADAAEYVGQSAGGAAESLRELDKEVQEGERNELGIKRKADDAEDDNARVKFEKVMDTTKEVGSKTIGAGQVAVATGKDLTNRSSTRLQDAFYTVCDRAQDDPEYHSAISILFDLVQKRIDRSLDSAGDVNQATSLDAFIDDPTPDKHLLNGIHCMRTWLERLAGDKSLDKFFCTLRVCGVDIQQDDDVRRWCDGFIAHLRKSLDERGYVRSEEAQYTLEKLRNEWQELLDMDSAKGRKWKEDVD